jgi:hypothetical protein
MIKKLKTSNLLPEQIILKVEKYLEATKELSMQEPFIKRITNLLDKNLETLKNSYEAMHTSDQLGKVAEYDAIRDDLFVGFKESIDSFRRRRNEKLIEAYEKIWAVIEKEGTNLYKLSYDSQTERMESLFRQLEEEEHTKALRTLNAYDLFLELKWAQTEFNEVYNEHLDEEAKSNYPTLSEAKGEIIPHINILIDAISILEETEPGRYTRLVDEMNSITDDILRS